MNGFGFREILLAIQQMERIKLEAVKFGSFIKRLLLKVTAIKSHYYP